MKFRIISFVISFVALFANADDVDLERLCKLDIESEKIYSSIGESELKDLISTFESLEKLSELERIASHSYQGTVETIVKHRNVDKQEAELIVLKMHKDIELARMKKAIELRSVDDPAKWEKEFDKCVREGTNMMGGQGG